MHSLKSIGKDTLIYLPATVLPALMTFISLPIYTRLFQPADFGYYAIAMTTISLLTSLFLGWLGKSALRFYEESKQKNTLSLYHTSIFISTLGLALGSSALTLIALYFFGSIFNPKLLFLLTLSIACFVINGVYRVYLSILRAGRFSIYYTSIEIVTAFLKLAIAVGIIIYFNFGIEGILIGFLIANIITLVPVLFKLHVFNHVSPKQFSLDWSKMIFSYGYPISLVSLSSWLLSPANRYIIGILRDSSEVGLYSVAYNLSEKPLVLLFSGIMLAAFPVLISVWEKEGAEQAQILINKVSRYYLIIFIPVIILLSVFSKELIRIISTEDYTAGHIIIPFIAIGAFFLGLSQYLAKGFELQKKTSTLASVTLIAGLTNVLISSILVYFFGFIGCGVSTMVSYLLMFVLIKIRVKPFLNVNFSSKSIFRICVASLIFLTLLSLTKWLVSITLLSIFGIAIICIGLYLTVLLILGEFNANEKKAIKTIFSYFKSATG